MNKLPTQTKKTNTTGITGVAITDSFCHSYIVNDSGKRLSRKYSLAKYGKDEALRLAIKWRRDNELKLHGYSVISAALIHQKFKHIQSARKANRAAQLKKLAALEDRKIKQREFAQRKEKYQKMAEKYIYRIDDLDLGHGWLLRIEIGKEVVCNMNFRDSRYGSAQDALYYAQNERANQLTLHNIPHARGRRFSKIIRSTNSTGVTGTCLSGPYYHSYISTLPQKRKSRKFSINKYGEELAFQMAVEWRQKMENEIYGATAPTVNQNNGKNGK